jgi:hypothetical protein
MGSEIMGRVVGVMKWEKKFPVRAVDDRKEVLLGLYRGSVWSVDV